MGEHQLDKLGVTGSSPVPPIEKPCKSEYVGKRSAPRWSGEGGYWVAAGVCGEGLGEVGEERLLSEAAGDRGGEESFDGAFAVFGLLPCESLR